MTREETRQLKQGNLVEVERGVFAASSDRVGWDLCRVNYVNVIGQVHVTRLHSGGVGPYVDPGRVRKPQKS